MIRIVKMTFQPEKVDEFLAMFNERKNKIRNFEGCQHLELWQDRSHNNVFFTYSVWDKPDSLQHYRRSDLFKDIWSKAKACFADKPEAWSVDREEMVDQEKRL